MKKDESFFLLMGQICAKFSKNCSLAVKSNIFAGCLAFDMVMNIRYRASCEINIFDRKIEFYIFTYKISTLTKLS